MEHARTDLIGILMNANELDAEVEMKLAGCLGRIFKLIGDREHADLL
jgi:hypothetical protein